MQKPSPPGRAALPDPRDSTPAASTFVWPPPEEDLDDWQVLPLFAPAARELLPSPPELAAEDVTPAAAAPLVTPVVESLAIVDPSAIADAPRPVAAAIASPSPAPIVTPIVPVETQPIPAPRALLALGAGQSVDSARAPSAPAASRMPAIPVALAPQAAPASPPAPLSQPAPPPSALAPPAPPARVEPPATLVLPSLENSSSTKTTSVSQTTVSTAAEAAPKTLARTTTVESETLSPAKTSEPTVVSSPAATDALRTRTDADRARATAITVTIAAPRLSNTSDKVPASSAAADAALDTVVDTVVDTAADAAEKAVAAAADVPSQVVLGDDPTGRVIQTEQVIQEEATAGSGAGRVLGRVALVALALAIAGGSAYLTMRWMQPSTTVGGGNGASRADQAATPAAAAGSLAAGANGDASATDAPGASAGAARPTSAADAGTSATLPESSAILGSLTTVPATPEADRTIAADATLLEVRSTPNGARVVVGGAFRGYTPLLVRGLPPGRHDVLIGAPFPSLLRRADVTAGRRTLLDVSPADASAPRARPTGDGASGTGASEAGASETGAAAAGAATSTSTPLPTTVPPADRAAAPTATPRAVDPPANRAAEPGASPTPAPAPPAPAGPPQGRLIVSSPLALDIQANGRRIGNSGDGAIALAPGDYELELTNDSVDYREVTTIHLAAGQRLTLPVTVPRGTLTIDTEPGARVWIDGREAGQTPLAALTLPIGPHDVRLHHPQLGDRRLTALVRLGRPASLTVDFRTP